MYSVNGNKDYKPCMKGTMVQGMFRKDDQLYIGVTAGNLFRRACSNGFRQGKDPL